MVSKKANLFGINIFSVVSYVKETKIWSLEPKLKILVEGIITNEFYIIEILISLFSNVICCLNFVQIYGRNVGFLSPLKIPAIDLTQQNSNKLMVLREGKGKWNENKIDRETFELALQKLSWIISLRNRIISEFHPLLFICYQN